ncbi:YbjN domain-containing protein [Boudabousia marimammalium]|uniref:Uncharacterized protein n=1 Tax=Boudabousia marimammalium TaxID=156892 RepID=A0A1Q5PSQ9_9ACTO|nr:YbjN domain-containing protein [Boudabousia marimammalium]OKL50624.1 hypothetical protein BM477_01335 [Boudabousia marimammalium]
MSNPTPDNTQLRPLTIERITELFDSQGFNYQVTDGQIQTGFGDVPMQIQLEAGGAFVLFRGMWHASLSEQNAAIANSHISQRHRTTYFPTFYTIQDNDGYQVIADVCLFIGQPGAEGQSAGITDAQLASYLGVFEMLEREISELSEAVTADLS